MRHSSTPATALLLLSAWTLASSCSAPTAEDLVRDLVRSRNDYEVRLTSWVVREHPGAPSSLYLDVLILNNSDKSLRTLTLLVEQLDANDQLLASQRVAAEVTALTPGISQTVGVELGPAHSSVEGIRLILELDPGPEIWDQFPEFNAVRPRR